MAAATITPEAYSEGVELSVKDLAWTLCSDLDFDCGNVVSPEAEVRERIEELFAGKRILVLDAEVQS
jgi:hypothetical protein